ncbi:hypothetical protein [Alkalihalobacillus sp. TS-13]|uniref:hypothetical protein n=1 Tax=Alkalihalobacillus sp. TS-13 TaxID=2842455 RepID=UPI001C88599C|nr:hypothetical protein [Alkalihalobacillus sp. TS-13]
MELYRIFYTFRTRELNFLTITGMDMVHHKLFSVLVYSPEDSIDLDHSLSPDIPSSLKSLLLEQKHQIDTGYYDLASWETNVIH